MSGGIDGIAGSRHFRHLLDTEAVVVVAAAALFVVSEVAAGAFDNQIPAVDPVAYPAVGKVRETLFD